MFVSDAAFVDVALREVLGVDPLRRPVDARNLDPLHKSSHPWRTLDDEHDLTIDVSI